MEPTTEITPGALFDRLVARGEAPAILDVRNEDEFAAWRIEGRRPIPHLNVPYFAFIDEPEASAERVAHAGRTWIAVCAKGDSSAFVAEILRERGIGAVNLVGGMQAWGDLQVPVRVAGADGGLELWQINRYGKGCLSYVVLAGGQAVVVDASRHVEIYEAFLRERRSALAHVLDTHVHADHLSGGAELARRAGVPYHPAADPAQSLDAQTELRVGDGDVTIRIGVISTPGHTPGSRSYLVDGRWLLSGDTLFVSGIGRPDLGGHVEEWGRALFRTLHHGPLGRLPDEVVVLPAHFASPGELDAAGVVQRRLGEIRRASPELQLAAETAFVEALRRAAKPPPEVYQRIIAANLTPGSVSEEQASEWELGKNQCAAALPAATHD